MYFFGMDVPFVELIFAMGIITIIILLEAIIILYLVLHHKKKMHNFKIPEIQEK